MRKNKSRKEPKAEHGKEFSLLEDMSDQYRKTNPSLTYINICNEFKINPPKNDWDGVYDFKSK